MNENLVEVATETTEVATQVASKASGLTKFFSSVPGKATGVAALLALAVGGTLVVEHKVIPMFNKQPAEQNKSTAEATKEKFNEESNPTK